MASKISLKLLVDNKTKKVLFAEAGKEFVDFVFSLLTLPIGAVVKLISAGTMHGSIGRLYQSVDNISASYLLPTTDKKDLLQPKVLQPDGGELLLLQGAAAGAGDDGVSPLGRFRMYNCPGHCVTVAMEAGAVCPQCRRAMDMEMTFVPPSAAPKAGVGKGGGARRVREGRGDLHGDGLEVSESERSATHPLQLSLSPMLDPSRLLYFSYVTSVHRSEEVIKLGCLIIWLG